MIDVRRRPCQAPQHGFYEAGRNHLWSVGPYFQDFATEAGMVMSEVARGEGQAQLRGQRKAG